MAAPLLLLLLLLLLLVHGHISAPHNELFVVCFTHSMSFAGCEEAHVGCWGHQRQWRCSSSNGRTAAIWQQRRRRISSSSRWWEGGQKGSQAEG
jgi:hypothetical protein